MASSGTVKLLNFLRENESSLLSLRPRKPGSAQPLATGWNATRGKLLREAIEGILGQERSLSLEQRWGKVLCKVLLSAGDEVSDGSKKNSTFPTSSEILGPQCTALDFLCIHCTGFLQSA